MQEPTSLLEVLPGKAEMADQPLLLRAYTSLLTIGGPLAALGVLHTRQKRGKEMAGRLGERKGRASRARPIGPLIWVHAASVGEFVSVLPLVEALVERGFNLLVTTGTVTSARLAAVRLPAEAIHQFVPLDVPAFARRFYDHWKPELIVFTESELWPSLLWEAKERSIPVVIANARISLRSYRRWQRAGRAIRALLDGVDLCLAQSEADAQRLASLGAPRVENAGNLKFDVPPPPAAPALLRPLRDAVFGRPVFVAASTHPGEEEIIAAVHATNRKKAHNLLTIIVPRHPERADEIAQSLERFGLHVTLRSRHTVPDWNTDIFVADTIGELGLFYRLADVAFVGGSLVEHGGQNPIEAAKIGVPIVHGPHVGNFADIYPALDTEKGAIEVQDGSQLAATVGKLLGDTATRELMRRAAKQVMVRQSGALERTLTAIEPYLLQFNLTRAHARS